MRRPYCVSDVDVAADVEADVAAAAARDGAATTGTVPTIG
jgi:hypothetical protein